MSLNPQHSRAYSVLALLEMVDGEHARAVAPARKAVGLSPNSAEEYLNLAIVLTDARMVGGGAPGDGDGAAAEPKSR